ncbi:MAG: DNA-binding MarR family transcriptional regulator [Halocynthiibacter sp.]|jgi:DNA-binding MarR family transcriptional regulator
MAKLKIVQEANEAGSGVSQNDLLGLVGYNLKRAYMLIHGDFRATLEALNVSQRTFSVLSVVVENPDISQSDVARALGIERSGTVVIVDELENRDMIERNKVPGDRRAYALRVTKVGQAAYREALAIVQAHEDTFLSNFSEKERTVLRELLSRIHGVSLTEE